MTKENVDWLKHRFSRTYLSGEMLMSILGMRKRDMTGLTRVGDIRITN